eukprot:g37829.t1
MWSSDMDFIRREDRDTLEKSRSSLKNKEQNELLGSDDLICFASRTIWMQRARTAVIMYKLLKLAFLTTLFWVVIFRYNNRLRQFNYPDDCRQHCPQCDTPTGCPPEQLFAYNAEVNTVSFILVMLSWYCSLVIALSDHRRVKIFQVAEVVFSLFMIGVWIELVAIQNTDRCVCLEDEYVTGGPLVLVPLYTLSILSLFWLTGLCTSSLLLALTTLMVFMSLLVAVGAFRVPTSQTLLSPLHVNVRWAYLAVIPLDLFSLLLRFPCYKWRQFYQRSASSRGFMRGLGWLLLAVAYASPNWLQNRTANLGLWWLHTAEGQYPVRDCFFSLTSLRVPSCILWQLVVWLGGASVLFAFGSFAIFVFYLSGRSGELPCTCYQGSRRWRACCDVCTAVGDGAVWCMDDTVYCVRLFFCCLLSRRRQQRVVDPSFIDTEMSSRRVIEAGLGTFVRGLASPSVTRDRQRSKLDFRPGGASSQYGKDHEMLTGDNKRAVSPNPDGLPPVAICLHNPNRCDPKNWPSSELLDLSLVNAITGQPLNNVGAAVLVEWKQLKGDLELNDPQVVATDLSSDTFVVYPNCLTKGRKYVFEAIASNLQSRESTSAVLELTISQPFPHRRQFPAKHVRKPRCIACWEDVCCPTYLSYHRLGLHLSFISSVCGAAAIGAFLAWSHRQDYLAEKEYGISFVLFVLGWFLFSVAVFPPSTYLMLVFGCFSRCSRACERASTAWERCCEESDDPLEEARAKERSVSLDDPQSTEPEIANRRDTVDRLYDIDPVEVEEHLVIERVVPGRSARDLAGPSPDRADRSDNYDQADRPDQRLPSRRKLGSDTSSSLKVGTGKGKGRQGGSSRQRQVSPSPLQEDDEPPPPPPPPQEDDA